MKRISRYWPRIALTLIPLIFALLHASGLLQIGVLQLFDDIIYDARLQATMPGTLDERIVIVDIDEKSLGEVGRWPWSRNKLADLVAELQDRQQVALLGFDVVFAEPDESSGLKKLQQLAQDELKNEPGFAEALVQLQPSLDYDGLFARSIQNRRVVMGFYFTSDRDGRTSGTLPAPAMSRESLQGRSIGITSWNGYGANLEQLAKAAPSAGFVNSITESDGVVRSIPLLAEFRGQYYESLALAMFRMLLGSPQVEPDFPQDQFLSKNYKGLDGIFLRHGSKTRVIPVDNRVAMLVPYRGRGGVNGGSFRYISAADVLAKRMAPGLLKDKIILIGTTAPGLLDLRETPVGATYPGVEAHANVISGLLDGKVLVKPDYAAGFEIVVLFASGMLLVFIFAALSVKRAVIASVVLIAGLIALNFWLFAAYGLVLPLAGALGMTLAVFSLNMSYGYFVETRLKRELANLFGTYVPPELVDEMVKNPDSYNMTATTKELTVMFCDIRGFTKMSESMEPTQLQALLNSVFSRLTELISQNRGTIDKYMGDCVMAFWGAPASTPEHARLAVKTALEIATVVQQINAEHRAKGLPEIGFGIGLNTGTMCVGDMGSNIRRSYTVIGDAVNIGSRLEELSKIYGVDIVVSEATRMQAPNFSWQELDKVRLRGKNQTVGIYCPALPFTSANTDAAIEAKAWGHALKAYRAQDWNRCEDELLSLHRLNPQNYLYQLYAQRVTYMKLMPFDPAWDGASSFDTNNQVATAEARRKSA